MVQSRDQHNNSMGRTLGLGSKRSRQGQVVLHRAVIAVHRLYWHNQDRSRGNLLGTLKIKKLVLILEPP